MKRETNDMQVTLRWLFVMSVLLAAAMPARAATGTWTNYVGTLSDYWTNSANWTGASYPGSAATESAFLTDSVAVAYTNILDSTFGRTITTLAISNSTGQAWLVVTNAALTNTTFALNSGGRLRIDNGGLVTGITTFTWLGTNGVIQLNNGGRLFTTGLHIIGAGGSVTGLVTSTSGAGNGGVWNRNAGALTIGGATGHGNLISITDGAVVTNVGAITLTGNQNSLIVTNGGKLFGAGTINVGSAAGNYGNTVILGDGVWSIGGANQLLVGTENNASNNTFISRGGTVTNAAGLIVGGLPNTPRTGNNYNSVIFTNGGGFFMTAAGPVQVGAAGNQQGGGSHNTVILSNSVLWSSGTSVIGKASTNNVMTLLMNTVWDGGVQALYVGGWGGITAGGVSNTLTISGGLLTNFTSVGIGHNSSGGSFGNRLIIENGGVLSNFTRLFVGSYSGNNDNSLIVTNGGRLILTGLAAQSIGIGADLSGGVGGSGNTVILSNSVVTMVGDTPTWIGSGSSNNTVTLLANTVWNNTGTLTIGTGAALGNALLIDGGAMTIAATKALTIGATSGSISNTVVVSNGGVLTNLSSFLSIGSAPGAVGNSLIVTNGGRYIMDVGRVGVGATTSGGAGGGGNSLMLSNSQVTVTTFHTHVGYNSSNNTVTLLADTVWNNGNWQVNLGSGPATGNVLNVRGGVLTNISTLSVGLTSGALENHVRVTDSGLLGATAVTVGSVAGANNNSLLVTNGGILAANSLTVGGTSGNSISNRGGVFQFTTATPTITKGTGVIAIDNGTVSFKNLPGVVNLTNNWVGSQLINLTWIGANTLRLDNSTATNTLASGYIFQTGAGATNYYRLEMINTATAISGNGITIGASGSFLASNTVATISGNFTNNGTAAIVDATVNFQSALDVAGTLTLRNGFAIGAGAKTVGGTLRGNGSVVGDATVSGILTPGLSVGTLVFSNNLTLAGSYQAEFGDGGNDQLIVVGDLTLAGATLDLTAVGGVTGAAYVIASYGDLFGTFSVTNGMPVGYMVDYNYNGAKQIAIVVIPEPGSLVLVVLGMIGFGIVYHYRRARV